jgi:sulfur carrier protein
MNVTINGKPRTLAGEQNITDLLATLEVKPELVAVAINGDVVRRRDWPQTTVHADDVIEIVRAVGGGAQ